MTISAEKGRKTYDTATKIEIKHKTTGYLGIQAASSVWVGSLSQF